ncbi:hypothetical protein L208DRAFT_1319881, partial [Tricholoma matsutake]
FMFTLHTHLLDVGKDPHTYGCHSCCRGGTQWLAREKRWSIPCICDWGGWLLDFSHATILKYLFARNDDPYEAHKDFFNQKKRSTRPCFT